MRIEKINNWAVEIKDFDLKTATKDDVDYIIWLVLTNLVVVIRNQQLTGQDELRFCGYSGDYPSTIKDKRFNSLSTEYDGIIRVTGQPDEDGNPGLFGHCETLDWHCNRPSAKDRKPIVWIYGVSGTYGSRTSWANGVLAYRELPENLKKELNNYYFYCGYKKGRYSPSDLFKEHVNYDLKHTLVHTNEAGVTGLFFPFLQIIETNIPDDLFNWLKNHYLQERFIYHHDWQDGDVVLSEQWLSIHKRWLFSAMDKRLLHRITFDYRNVNLEKIKKFGYLSS